MNISVVIPVYNRMQRLFSAIDSVLRQSLLAAEIIVVDDGSTDGVFEQIGNRYPEITVVAQPNCGVGAARNLGIRQAKGEWLAFLDSDDIWLPGKLEQQARLLASESDLRVCHTDEIWIRNGKRVNPMHKHAKPRGWIYPQCLPLCCVSPSSILFHRDVLQNVGDFDETLPVCEDYDLWLRIFNSYQAGLVDKPLLEKYGGHEDQLSRKYWGMDRFRVKALLKMLEAGSLDECNHASTVEMLVKKCRILEAGCLKRWKYDEAKIYRDLILHWSGDG